MALTEGFKQALLMDGSVQNLIASTIGLNYYSAWIFFHALLAGDSIQITVYVNDPQSSTERIYDQFTVSGLQAKPAVFIPNLPTDSFRVTAQQTAGTNRTINVVRYDN